MRARSVGGAAALAVALVTGAAGPGVASDSGQSGRSVRAVARGLPPLPDMGVDGEWWFTSWRIPQVWATGARGQGITVAVIDTGVQASFPELRDAVLPGTNFRGGDGRTDEGKDVEADPGKWAHGTQMALAIVGQGGPLGLVGVAPEAKVLPVVRGGQLVREFRWAVDHGAKVINASFGSPGTCLPEESEGVQYALDHGVVVVAAAGNHPSVPHRPGDCPGVIAVGAFDSRLRLWDESDRGPFLAVAAPGVHMLSIDLDRRKGYGNGTSDAAALTSGAIALVWSKYPQLTGRQVVARLLATAKDLGPPGFDEGFGYGGIRPYQAITTEVPADAPNPIFDRATAATASPSATSQGDDLGDSSSASRGAGIGLLILLLVIGGSMFVVLAVVAVIVLVLLSRRSSRRGAVPPHR